MNLEQGHRVGSYMKSFVDVSQFGWRDDATNLEKDHDHFSAPTPGHTLKDVRIDILLPESCVQAYDSVSLSGSLDPLASNVSVWPGAAVCVGETENAANG